MGINYLVVLQLVILATHVMPESHSICLYRCNKNVNCNDDESIMQRCTAVHEESSSRSLNMIECTITGCEDEEITATEVTIDSEGITTTVHMTEAAEEIAITFTAGAPQELLQEFFDSVLFSMNISVVKAARLLSSLAVAEAIPINTNISVSNIFMLFSVQLYPTNTHIESAGHFRYPLDVPFKTLSS